jgi:hypothetical protein
MGHDIGEERDEATGINNVNKNKISACFEADRAAMMTQTFTPPSFPLFFFLYASL